MLKLLQSVKALGEGSGLKQLAGAAAFAAIFASSSAIADSASPYALQQALSSDGQAFDLYAPKQSGGFKVGSSYFSGPSASPTASDDLADFGNNQQMYALLIDGRYDFDYDVSALSAPLHPYLIGSMGMARMSGYANNLDAGTSTVPLFRLGGGVAYRLDERWDMSLDYKAGLASSSPTDYLFTGRGQQQVDTQTLNLGMHYAF